MNSQKYLNENEVMLLELFLKNRLKSNPREALLFLVALKTGARASELLNIKKTDLNLFNKSVFIRGLKGSNDREIPINNVIFTTLNKYASTIEGDLIFPISYERLAQLWYQWRTTKKKLHALRHTCALQLYKKSKDINLVKQVMGHKSIMSTMIYQSYCYNQNQLRKFIT